MMLQLQHLPLPEHQKGSGAKKKQEGKGQYCAAASLVVAHDHSRGAVADLRIVKLNRSRIGTGMSIS